MAVDPVSDENTLFIYFCYAFGLRRPPSTANVSDWIAYLEANGKAATFHAIVFSPEGLADFARENAAEVADTSHPSV